MRNFNRVIDNSEIHMTPLKFQIVFLCPQLFYKGNILQNYFIGKYPHNSGVIDPSSTDFDDFRNVNQGPRWG
jgi:hypothetical protein